MEFCVILCAANTKRGGQNRAEQVDRINRNEWTESSGMGGQGSPEYADKPHHQRNTSHFETLNNHLFEYEPQLEYYFLS